MNGRWGYGKRVNSACYGCPTRTESCHATCQVHAEERERRAADRAATLADRIAGRQVGEYKYGVKTRMLRKVEAAKRK